MDDNFPENELGLVFYPFNIEQSSSEMVISNFAGPWTYSSITDFSLSDTLFEMKDSEVTFTFTSKTSTDIGFQTFSDPPYPNITTMGFGTAGTI